MSDETVITKTDITNPKKVAQKVGKGIVLGAGGASQELLRSALTKLFPNQKQEFISSLVQFIGLGLVNGMVSNQYADSFLSGAIAGAGKDMFKNAKAFIENLMGKGVISKQQATSIMSTSYPSSFSSADAF